MGARTDNDVVEANRREPPSDPPAADFRTAVTELWYMWAVSLLSVIAAVYFATTRDLVASPAEPFYAIIFGSIALITAVYGAYAVRQRTTPF